jgi:serine/threonine protein phosphatase PrpC/serine/threonine protein kinase
MPMKLIKTLHVLTFLIPVTAFLVQQSPVVTSTARFSTSNTASAAAADTVLLEIQKNLGNGSYGTVHLVWFYGELCVGKRAWTRDEFATSKRYGSLDATTLDDKAARCQVYFETEAHCLRKLKGVSGVLTLRDVVEDNQHLKWMVFDLVSAGTEPAPSLQNLLDRETNDRRQSSETSHHLDHIAKALGLEDHDLAVTLDVILEQLLQILTDVHARRILHRDLKPANILIQPNQRLTLIDFGSAADLDTAGLLQKKIGLDKDRVAVSPIYTAPEIFCDASLPRAAMTFDVFSTALLFCQLLFQLTDERTDAGFHQQLESVGWNLDAWLANELQGTVVPSGLDEALEVLGERRGQWGLLQQMLAVDPRNRITAADALRQFSEIRLGKVDKANDGEFLLSVLESCDSCPIPTVRLLQFVATFKRSEPLGLILAEAEANDDDDSLDPVSFQAWKRATLDAAPGEVFVKGIVNGGQADEKKIFEMGDRLQGVGELPLKGGGFEEAVSMLQDQPKSADYVTLHFDRKSNLVPDWLGQLPIPAVKGPIQVTDQGAWSIRGRRTSQEDAFLMHEVHDANERSIRLAGIMDGHLGEKASAFVRDTLPNTFYSQLADSRQEAASVLLEQSWNDICDMYRRQCDNDECTAEYDPFEGVLKANTGSASAVPGTAAVIFALDMQTSQLAFLNCGDSRGLLVDANGNIQYSTTDHTPGTETEAVRLAEGRAEGLEYGEPTCKFSTWRIPVGEYTYAVSRSLEGTFATSRGIVSTPDVRSVQAQPGMTSILASDGLWEIMDSEEVAAIVRRLRFLQKSSAGDAAKALCSLALEKGSSDNISVVVAYLD